MRLARRPCRIVLQADDASAWVSPVGVVALADGGEFEAAAAEIADHAGEVGDAGDNAERREMRFLASPLSTWTGRP